MAKQATRTATRNKPHLMMQIAVMRYKMNYTQAEIAKRLNLSTMTVSRLLDKAREEGIVTFHVKTPVETDSVLEEKLRERYGFDEAFVIRNGMGQGDAEMISRAIAFYLDMIISPGDILGIGIGRTTNRLMPYLTLPSIAQPSDLEVVQLSGGLNGTSEHNPVSSLQEFTRQFGIRGRFLQLPIYAPTLEAFKAMESSYLGEMRELWPLGRRPLRTAEHVPAGECAERAGDGRADCRGRGGEFLRPLVRQRRQVHQTPREQPCRGDSAGTSCENSETHPHHLRRGGAPIHFRRPCNENLQCLRHERKNGARTSRIERLHDAPFRAAGGRHAQGKSRRGAIWEEGSMPA